MKLNAETRSGSHIPHPRIVANETYLARPNMLVDKSNVNPVREIDHMLRSARFQGPVTRSKLRISF